MTCTACNGGQMRVMNSRSDVPGVVRRKRQCPDCSARISTYEVEVPADQSVILERDGRGRLRVAVAEPVPLYRKVAGS